MTLWFIVRHFDLCNVSLGRVCEKLRIYVLGVCLLIQKNKYHVYTLSLMHGPYIWNLGENAVPSILRDAYLTWRYFVTTSFAVALWLVGGIWRINNLAHHYVELLLLVPCSPAQTLHKPILISWCRHQMEFKQSQNLHYCIIPQPHQQATGLLTFSPIHTHIYIYIYRRTCISTHVHTCKHAYQYICIRAILLSLRVANYITN